MRLNDLALGILTAGLGAVLTAVSLGLPGVPGQELGAGFFPALLGGATILAGGALILGGLKQRQEPWLIVPAWMRDPWAVVNLLIMIGAIAIFAAFSDRIGFLPFAVVLLAVVQLRLGIRPMRAGVIAVLGAIGFQGLFNGLLRVPLPPGLLEGWL
jgi:putative tricarboxylic transport membrane protein